MLNCWKRKNGCCARSLKAHGNCPLPLSDAQSGERLRVASIAGGRNLCGRMAAMGIYPGVEMELLCSGCGSPCLIKVHGGTISLGAGESRKIMVTSNLA